MISSAYRWFGRKCSPIEKADLPADSVFSITEDVTRQKRSAYRISPYFIPFKMFISIQACPIYDCFLFELPQVRYFGAVKRCCKVSKKTYKWAYWVPRSFQ